MVEEVLQEPAEEVVTVLYDYQQKGDDWGDIVFEDGTLNWCGETGNQSPINLMQPLGTYGWVYGAILPIAADESSKSYTDLSAEVTSGWDTNTLKVELTEI